ncbi:conserved membrane hypothetical protein [Flavobacterium sp. 9R]|mgnify:FL=1|jgi:hypothetical protein|nr:conserved membrane hypothetical protein [Flavobacterium sp. 9R]
MATLFYFYYNETLFQLKEKGFVLLQITILTVIVPILIYFLLKTLNKIDSVMAYDLGQRKIPLVLQSFLFILLVKRSITIDRYFELHFFFLAALMSTLIALLLLFAKIKASIHMLAFSSLTVFVTGLHLHHPEHFPLIVPFLIFMNGVIASSRLVMQAHTPKELIIGFLSGSIPQLLLLVVWL